MPLIAEKRSPLNHTGEKTIQDLTKEIPSFSFSYWTGCHASINLPRTVG